MIPLKRFFYLLIFPFLVWGLERFCHHQTEGFSLNRVQSYLSFHPEWEVPPLPPQELEEIKALLRQKFTYLARGAQAYAFMSEDGLYVIKLFQHYRMRPPFWASWLPSHFSEKKIAKRKALLHHDFDSYAIAYNYLREETGLVCLHLNKTTLFNQNITLVDKLGIAHVVPLDNLEFLVQKRATLAYSVLQALMREGKMEEAQNKVALLLALVLKRCQKGIFDKDPDFSTNFGFCDDKAIQIDVGRFRLDPSRSSPEVFTIDLIHAFDPFKMWLETHYPPLIHEKDPMAYLSAHSSLHSPL